MSIEFQNLGTIDMPATGGLLLIEWSNGSETTRSFSGQIGPVLHGDSDDVWRTKATLGPFDIPVQAGGTNAVSFRLNTWPPVSPPFFEDAKGRELSYDQQNDLVPIGTFDATSREILYQKLRIIVGVIAAVVGLTGLLAVLLLG